MTNYDRAVQVIYDEANKMWERGEILTAAGEAERLANALADAGLLAPDLAQEILRMRSELKSMRSAWLPLYADPERTPTEQEFAAHVVDHIDQLLGDH